MQVGTDMGRTEGGQMMRLVKDIDASLRLDRATRLMQRRERRAWLYGVRQAERRALVRSYQRMMRNICYLVTRAVKIGEGSSLEFVYHADRVNVGEVHEEIKYKEWRHGTATLK